MTCEAEKQERRERLAFIRSLREKTKSWTKQDRYACFAQENIERRVEMKDLEDLEVEEEQEELAMPGVKLKRKYHQ